MRRAAPALAVLAAALALAGCASTPVSTPTAAPATSVATTEAAAPTTTTPPPVPVQHYTGTGSDVVELTTPIQFGLLTLDCSKCSGNVIVKTDADIDPDLVNRIGGYSEFRTTAPLREALDRLAAEYSGGGR